MARQDPGVVSQIREGMRVITAQNEDVGVVAELWIASDPAERQLTRDIQDRQVSYQEALQLQHGVFLEVRPGPGGDTMFIPWQAVADATGDTVMLLVNEQAAEASQWRVRPAWAGDPQATPGAPIAAPTAATGEGTGRTPAG